MRLLDTIRGQDIFQLDDLSFSFIGQLSIDADGCPRCYAPPGIEALDHLANAGHDGNWFGVVTHNGQPNGRPIIQGDGDPYPGYYISSTSLQNKDYPISDTRRYVDSENVPYAVVPGGLARKATGIVLGSYCTITDTRSGISVGAVCADTGPKTHLGEASMAAAKLLGVNPSPKTGGCDEYVFKYTFYPGTAAPGFELQPL